MLIIDMWTNKNRLMDVFLYPLLIVAKILLLTGIVFFVIMGWLVAWFKRQVRSK